MTEISRLEQIKTYLTDCAARGHYAPTLREIGAHVGLRAVSVVKHHVDKLVREGFCERSDKGHIRMKQPQAVAVRSVRAIVYGDGHTYLPPVSSKELKAGKSYRLEVYEC